MIIDDHAYMTWQRFKLNGYAKFLATGVDMSIAILYDREAKLGAHSKTKEVFQPFLGDTNTLKVVNAGFVGLMVFTACGPSLPTKGNP
jgi:hypothetical protein